MSGMSLMNIIGRNIGETLFAQPAPAAQPQPASPAAPGAPASPAAPSTQPICPVIPSHISNLQETTENMMFMTLMLAFRYMIELKLATRPGGTLSTNKLNDVAGNIVTIAPTLINYYRGKTVPPVLAANSALNPTKLKYANNYYYTKVFRPLAKALLGSSIVTNPATTQGILRTITRLNSTRGLADPVVTQLLRNPNARDFEVQLLNRLKTLAQNPGLKEEIKTKLKSMMFMTMILSLRYMIELSLSRRTGNALSTGKLNDIATNIVSIHPTLVNYYSTRTKPAILTGTDINKTKLKYANDYYYTQVFRPITKILLGSSIVTNPSTAQGIVTTLNSLSGTLPATMHSQFTPLLRNAMTSRAFEVSFMEKLIALRPDNELKKYAFEIANNGIPATSLVAQAGKQVKVVITGENLHQATKVVHPFGNSVQPTIVASNGNKTLTIEFTLPANVAPKQYALSLQNANKAVLSCLTLTVNKPGNGGNGDNNKVSPLIERFEKLRKIADIIDFYRATYGPEAGYDDLALRIGLGLPSFPLQRYKMNPLMRAGLDTASPMFETVANLGSPHRPLPALKTLKKLGDSAFFLLRFSAHGRMYVNPGYVDGGTANVLGGFGGSVNPTFYLMSKKATVGIEPFAGYSFNGSRYQEPTRFRHNSFYNTIFAGGALSVTTGKNDWFNARLAVTDSNSWEETTDDKTYAFPFSSTRQQLSVRLDFNLLSHLATKSKGAPDVWLTGEITPYGNALVPITTPGGGIGKLYDSLAKSWTARVTAFWRNVEKVRPFVTVEGSQLRQGQNDPVSTFMLNAGVVTSKAGLFRLGYRYTDNPEMYWGEQSHTVDLRWQAPSSFPTWARGLGANVFYNNTAGESNGGVMLHYDFSRLFR